jgi:hypothetical protein
MERHKIPWFQATNQSLNSHFEWIYPTYHQTSKHLMTFSEGQNGVVPPPFSCISHRRPAIFTRYINNIKTTSDIYIM